MMKQKGQAANYGSEKPDALGVAHSFRQAVEARATPEEIARNVGQHLNYVLNHLALANIPPELAQRIAAGELPMSVATAVADLPEPKRTGLAIFILANEVGKLTAKTIKECATTLKKWSGLQVPLMVKHQSQRNIARALVRLWGQVVEAYPEDAYAAAAMPAYRDLHEEPWSNKEKLTLWFQALGVSTGRPSLNTWSPKSPARPAPSLNYLTNTCAQICHKDKVGRWGCPAEWVKQPLRQARDSPPAVSMAWRPMTALMCVFLGIGANIRV